MNTKSKTTAASKTLESLFKFESKEQKTQHNAQIISYKILSEIEEILEQRNLKKKDLAEKIGISKSFITQLFRGTKTVNTNLMAKFEEALDIIFDIKASSIFIEEYNQNINAQVLQKNQNKVSKGQWYYCHKNNKDETSKNLISELSSKELKTQAA